MTKPSKELSDVLMQLMTAMMRRSATDFNRFMKEAGISMPQFHTMVRIYFDGPMGVSAIAQDVGFTKAASSQMIDRMTRMDLVTRKENPEDRRERQIDLSEKGRQLIEGYMSDNFQWMKRLGEKVPVEQRDTLVAVLRDLAEMIVQNNHNGQ